jgi:putative drug exporter of the RND superfamily
MFFAFAALSTGPETDLKVMATALGAGILLDATLVRALLVPALVALFGRWNWWLPAPARRLLRVPAPPARNGPAASRPATPAAAGTDGHRQERRTTSEPAAGGRRGPVSEPSGPGQ